MRYHQKIHAVANAIQARNELYRGWESEVTHFMILFESIAFKTIHTAADVGATDRFQDKQAALIAIQRKHVM